MAHSAQRYRRKEDRAQELPHILLVGVDMKSGCTPSRRRPGEVLQTSPGLGTVAAGHDDQSQLNCLQKREMSGLCWRQRPFQDLSGEERSRKFFWETEISTPWPVGKQARTARIGTRLPKKTRIRVPATPSWTLGLSRMVEVFATPCFGAAYPPHADPIHFTGPPCRELPQQRGCVSSVA